MNITQLNVDKLLQDAGLFVGNLGTGIMIITVTLTREHIKELLNEDFFPRYSYLSDNVLEIDLMSVKMIITIR